MWETSVILAARQPASFCIPFASRNEVLSASSQAFWSTFALRPNDFSIYLSLAFLFGIAARFKGMDGYSFLRTLISLLERRLGLLYAVILVTSIFSPIILNDVVILVLTPVLVRYAKQFNMDIAPLLVAEISFTNIVSSLTPPLEILRTSSCGKLQESLSVDSFSGRGSPWPSLGFSLLPPCIISEQSRQAKRSSRL